MADRSYIVEITMPSGEKLPPIPLDRDIGIIVPTYEIAGELARIITQLIERRLSA